jgi:uncharacterized protein (TIGR00369 family)
MRLLALESEQFEDGDVRGWLPVTPAIAAPGGGPLLSAVAMLVDALGGLRSISAAAPDWAFTADLSIHLLPTGPMEKLQADLRVRRRGRRTLVIEAQLLADGSRPAGIATMTFAVVPRPEHLVNITIDMTPGRRSMSKLDADQPGSGPYFDELELVVERPGLVTIELRPEVSNTVGALHGAVHTAIIDAASLSLGQQHLGPNAETVDIHLAFLDLATRGPLRAVATPVGSPTSGQDRLTVCVEVFDADDRLCSYATTEVVK